MRGVVVGINKQIGRIAVKTDLGYTVFDVIYGEFRIGTVVLGDLDNHGDADLTLESSGETVTVYIEAIQASKESAQSLLSGK